MELEEEIELSVTIEALETPKISLPCSIILKDICIKHLKNQFTTCIFSTSRLKLVLIQCHNKCSNNNILVVNTSKIVILSSLL